MATLHTTGAHLVVAFHLLTWRLSGFDSPVAKNSIPEAEATVPGLPIENQTLPEDRLYLTDDEQKAIVAFIHALNDTTSNPVK